MTALRERAAAQTATAGRAPLLIMLAGTLVTFLDFFIVNVALPSIETDLHAGPSAMSLVVAGYGLTFAVGMITGGRLGDIAGRRRMFALGLTFFTLTSLACGLAPTIEVLIAARVLQGAAGALLTPQVLAVLGTIYEGPARARAFAAYGVAMGVAGVLGQLVGGALIAADVAGLGWRAIFLINVPVGVVAVPLALRLVPESVGTRTRLDLAGAGLVTAALTALVLPLVTGREQHWPAWSIVSLALAPVLTALFVQHQRRNSRSPLVDLTLFRNRSFAVGSLLGAAFGIVPPAFFFVLALFLQQTRGYSALFSGLVFAAVGAGYFAAMLFSARLAARLGRSVLAVGALMVAGGAALLALEATAGSATELLPGLAVVGFGIGLVLVPLAALVLGGVDPQQAASASGVLSTAQQVGGALGVAVVGTVYFAGTNGAEAFRVGMGMLIGLVLVTAALSRRLPR